MAKKMMLEKRSRGEISEEVESNNEQISEKAEIIEAKASDVEVEHQSLESLELSGTSEGVECVQQHIETAREISEQEFTEESDQLEQLHEQTEESENLLTEQSESVTGDIEKISEVAETLSSDSAAEQFTEARQTAEQDVEFLNVHKEKLQQIRNDSVNQHAAQQQRVNTHRRN